MSTGAPPLTTRWQRCNYNDVIFAYLTRMRKGEPRQGPYGRAWGWGPHAPGGGWGWAPTGTTAQPAGRSTRRWVRKSTRTYPPRASGVVEKVRPPLIRAIWSTKGNWVRSMSRANTLMVMPERVQRTTSAIVRRNVSGTGG